MRSIEEMVREHRARMGVPVLACPYFKQDVIDPTRGMDGKMYETLSGYRKTLEPSGNPRGERYIEIGNEPTKAYEAPKFDRKKRRDDIKRAISDVKNGNVPSQTR